MEKTIYIDILLAVNLCADFVLLYLTGKLMHLKMHFIRLFSASLIGGVYAVVCEIFVKSDVLKFVSSLPILILMSVLAFKLNTFFSAFRVCLFVLIMSITLSGSFDILTNILSALFTYGIVEKIFSNPFIFFAVCTFFTFTLNWMSKFFARCVQKKTVQVEITLSDKRQKLTLLCDSGNVLRDAYSFLPVIVVKQSSVTSLIGENIYRLANNIENAHDLHIRFVPAKTAAGTKIFPAFKPDCVYILSNGKKVSQVMAVVALDDSDQNTYLDTDGIIPESLIQNVKV